MVATAHQIAKYNPNWIPGAPENGFEIFENVLFLRPNMLLQQKNLHFGATPYGQADIVSFVNDNVSSDFLINNYKVVIFSGRNTCSDKQYKILTDYVKAGGKLCLAIPHLFTDKTRRHDTFEMPDLVNGGDFSELCGLKLSGKGRRFYWATEPSRNHNDMGFILACCFGIMWEKLGELEYTYPANCYEALAVDDEDMRHVIIRCKSGKGEVFFINTWSHPGVLNSNNGTGTLDYDRSLIDYLYEYMAIQGCGHVKYRFVYRSGIFVMME